MTQPARTLGALAWLVALVLLATLAVARLEIGADLRLFLPTPASDAERLLVEEIGEGPAARLLLVALSGGEREARLDASRALARELSADDAFRQVVNGDDADARIPERLLPYRYLLTPAFDHEPLDAARLRTELETRLEDLASPLGPALEEWLPRDPTLELLRLAETWQGSAEIARDDGLFVSRDGTRALLAVETAAPGFDPDAQAEALARLDAAFQRVARETPLALEVSGPGRFAAIVKAQTQRDAARLSLLATLGMVAITWLAYRRASPILLAALPLASAAAAGLGAVALAFDSVHGITLAFGATLIGVAQDYPIHVLSHQHAGITPRANARALWPTLATGVASTCVAYATFLLSGVTGLAQLGTFTIAGLVAAAATTRWVLPVLVDPAMSDRAASPTVARIERVLERARVTRVAPWAIAIALAGGAAVAYAPGPAWQNDLAALTPLPRDLLARDAELRAELGAPDARHLVVVAGDDREAALARLEAFAPALEVLVADGAIESYEHAAQYLPSRARQLARRDALPDDARAARALVAAAAADLPFDPALFEPFVADLALARSLEPLAAGDFAGTALEARVGSLLLEREHGATAIVALTGLADAASVEAATRAAGVTLLDLKSASESLVARYRERIVACAALAALVLAAVVAFSLRSARRTARVLLPMLLSTLAIVAVLRLAGEPMSLFHLVALVLAAGLGLDYALFFDHAGSGRDEHRRTLHGLVVCAGSTLLVFALLASSSLPVLRAIGTTVTIGVVSNFLLALAFARRAAPPTEPAHA